MNTLVDEMVKGDILSKDNGTVTVSAPVMASGTFEFPTVSNLRCVLLLHFPNIRKTQVRKKCEFC